jgi:dUTP pyrophosphatase
MINLKDNDLVFAKVKPNAIIPTKEDENAGFDIYACFDEDYIIIPAHSTKLIPTGIASAMTEEYYLQVHERGSTGTKGMKYGAGVIDSGYRNEIFICINNVNDKDLYISKLDKDKLRDKLFPYDPDDYFIYPYSKAIAQLIVHKVHKMNATEIPYDELKEIPSKRGMGALGSSGK